MTLPAVVTVSGTWGRDGHGSFLWWKPGSVFIANLVNAGLALVSVEDYFDWSTGEDGVDKRNDVWESEGKALYWWWVAQDRPLCSAIGHSHAGQVIAYALQYGSQFAIPMTLEHLITAGTPVRADIDPIWQRVMTLALIKDWTHIYCDEVVDGSNLPYQYLGSLPLDPAFGFRRDMPHATRNVELQPPTTHHGLMWPERWNEHDWWQYLKGG